MHLNSESEVKNFSYFKEVVERGLEIIINIDSDYNIIYLNTSARDFFNSNGFNSENLSASLEKHIPVSKLREANVLSCIAGEVDLERDNMPPLQISYLLLSHAENDADLNDSFTLVIKDNTIKKSIELDFVKKSEELNRFIYRISHDLRGPIASMMGLSNLVGREINESKSLSYFELYKTQVERLNNIVTALSKHSLLTTSDQEPKLFSCQEVISDIIKSIEQSIDTSHISIKQKVTNAQFEGSEFAVHTILQSLLENSLTFRSAFQEPRIKIEIRDKKDSLEVMVEDNGIGIEKRYQKLIFQMFYRANDNSKGSGLGLYLFDTAVRKMKGTYMFESEIDKGTKFIVSLPYHQSLLKRK